MNKICVENLPSNARDWAINVAVKVATIDGSIASYRAPNGLFFRHPSGRVVVLSARDELAYLDWSETGSDSHTLQMRHFSSLGTMSAEAATNGAEMIIKVLHANLKTA